MALRGNFSGPVCTTDPVKASKDAASLLVCTQGLSVFSPSSLQ